MINTKDLRKSYQPFFQINRFLNMKHKPTLTYLLLVSILIGACKKEKKETVKPGPCVEISNLNSYDTIQPSSYVMAYPGSWWEYSDGRTDSIASSWKTMLLNISFDNSSACQFVVQDQKIIPMNAVNKYYVAFESYARFSNDYKKPTVYIRFISETPGVVCDTSIFTDHPTMNQDYTTMYKNTSYGKLPSLTVGSTTYHDVVHMQERVKLYYHHVGGGPVNNYDYFYAKNVGVIRKIRYYFDDPSTGDTTDLVNYYIAPH